MFPFDSTETSDTDGDGVGNNADLFPNDPSRSLDSDGDGVGDESDAFPYDPDETMDSDGDLIGDNRDAFPNDANESIDSDGDGVGNNADAFPYDANETMDSDGDGVGDNTDELPFDSNETVDSDNDGTGDNSDAFPLEFTQSSDSDGDGYGDNPNGLLADAFPNDPTEHADRDGDGVGDNSDAYPDNPFKWVLETDPNAPIDNVTENQSGSTDNDTENSSTNSTTVNLDFYFECSDNDLDCDGISNSEDDDADADGLHDGLVDSNTESTETTWLHDFSIIKTSDGFEIQIEYRIPLHPIYGSQVSYVMGYDENGDERNTPLIWDISTDGSFKMGVPSTHIDELERNMCQNPAGSQPYGIFDMYEWLNNSVMVNDLPITPEEIKCSWKNQPNQVNLDKITAEIQSEDFFSRMHKEYEIVKYTISYKVDENSTNLKIFPVYAVNQSSYISGSTKAFHVEDRVNGTTSVWFWWTQPYTSAFDLESAVTGEVSSGSSNNSSSGILFIVPIVLGILIVRRRKKKKFKRTMKKLAKQHIADEKAAKKQAKIDKKSQEKEYIGNSSTSETVSQYGGQVTQTTVEMPKRPSPRPSKDATGLIGDDGHEWITFPPNSQSHFYRVPGESDWHSWEN